MRAILQAAVLLSMAHHRAPWEEFGPDANPGPDNGKDGGGAPATTTPPPAAPPAPVLLPAEFGKSIADAVAGGVKAGVEAALKATEQRKEPRAPVTNNGTNLGAGGTENKGSGIELVEAYDNKAPGYKAARLLICNAKACLTEFLGKTPAEIAQEMAKHDNRYGEVYLDIAHRDEFLMRREKALSSGVGSEGGFMVQPTYADFVELLRPVVAVLQLGPRVLPMPTGMLNMGKLTSSASASYVGENVAKRASQQAFGELKLVAKKLMIIVPVSNDLLRRSNAEMVVRDDLQLAAGARKDLAFMRGDGGSGTPRGLKNWVLAANVVHAAGAAGAGNVSVAQVLKAFSDARSVIKSQTAAQANNGLMLQPGVIMSPRSEEFLMSLRDTAGWVFPEMQQGRIRNMPYAVSTQIPDNLGSGDESEVYVADFSSVLIGDTGTFGVESVNGAAYVDGDGNVVAGYSADQTVLRIIDEHDLAMRHQVKVALIDTIHWGA